MHREKPLLRYLRSTNGSLLNSPDSCHDLVELNYRRLMEVGTLKSRVEQILDILRKHAGLS